VLLNPILDLLLIILSIVVPKKTGQLLFGADLGTLFKGNPKYLFLYLQGNADLFPIWITGNKKVVAELSSRQCAVVYKYSVRGFWAILRSEWLFIDFTPKDVMYLGETAFGRFKFVQTTHGVPFKKGGQFALDEGRGRLLKHDVLFINSLIKNAKKALVYNFLLANYDVVVATSEETKRTSEYLFKSNNVTTCGMPRNDIFFNRKMAWNNLSEQMDLARYGQVILYAPTYRDNYASVTPFSEGFLAELDAYLRDTNKIILVKKHPLDSLISLPDSLTNIRIITEKVDDIQELLIHTDLLITDYSSVIFDYSLSGKPFLLFPYDYEEYVKSCRGFIYDYFEELPGPFARTETELMNYIRDGDSWFHSDTYQRKYESFSRKFNRFLDGHSCERCLTHVLKHPVSPGSVWRDGYV
jgi:CDP-glycerol glycerophosphotransferase (TagB/SpsB family)